MDVQLRLYKKIVLTGDWTALVRAASEAEVHTLHEQEQRLFPTLAQQYPGPFRIEVLPPAFRPPEPLAALERREFTSVEEALGLRPSAGEKEE